MMAIIIGQNRAEFCQFKKKDVSKPFFLNRNQFYLMYPEEQRAIDIYHDGAFIRSESATIFPENCNMPFYPKNPEKYEDDVILMTIDANKLMRGEKKKLFATVNSREFRNGLPWIITGLALLYGFLNQWGIL